MRSPPLLKYFPYYQHTTVVCGGGGLNKYQRRAGDRFQRRLTPGVRQQQEEEMIKPHTSLLAIFCFVALVGYAEMSSQAEPELVTESYMIQSRDPGIQLYVRNKRPDGMTQFSGEKTLLYVHGTSALSR